MASHVADSRDGQAAERAERLSELVVALADEIASLQRALETRIVIEQEDGADGEKRERPGNRVQEREVVEEELHEADAEEREASEPQHALPAGEANVQERQSERAPEGADAGVPALEVRLDVATRGELK